MGLSIPELTTLPGAEIDRRVRAYLLEPLHLSTPEGAQAASRRAELVTTLRTSKLWPPSERAKG